MHGEHVEIGLGHDVGDVAVDENLARREAGDLVGGHAAVRAADPEVFRALLVGEFAEEVRIVGVDRVRPVAVVFQEMIERFHGGRQNSSGITRCRPSRVQLIFGG